MKDLIEKAIQRTVGDVHPKHPDWVWTEYKPGKFDWRASNNKTAQNNSLKKPVPSKPSTQQIANAKARGSGKPMNYQQLAVWATKTSEDNLLKFANNKNQDAKMRKIAYDELEKRGFDMSKVDTSGTLDKLMKMIGGNKSNVANKTNTDDTINSNDDDVEEDDFINKISEKWYLNRNDDRIKKMFNLKTKEGRVKYDQFVYKQKIKEKDYMSPVEVVQDLNEQYLEFLDNDRQRFMVSAGGTGIGKSYGFHRIAELLNKKPFEEGDTPGDKDYDYFEAPDVNSGKQLLNVLKAHNGKIIVFDDNDKVLRRSDCAAVMKKATATTGARIISDPDDITQNFEFTGRIIVMTNKNLDELAENEDSKAIISRAMMVSEIYLTVPETIQLIEERFQDYEFKQAPRLDNEDEDRKERDEILDLIKKNQMNIDPAQFSSRTFQEILINKRKVDNANAKRKNPAFADIIGSKNKDWKEKAIAILTKSEKVDFGNNDISDELQKAEDLLLDETYSGILQKAEDLILGKGGNKHFFSEEEREELSKKKQALPDGSFPIRNVQDLKDAIRSVGRAKNPEKAKNWIKKRAKELGKEELLPDTWKAQNNDFFDDDDMTLEKAEELLLSDY